MIKFPKVNWEKVGAYAFGGLLGGGLSALAHEKFMDRLKQDFKWL